MKYETVEKKREIYRSQNGQALLGILLLFAAGTSVLLSGLGYAQVKDVGNAQASSNAKQSFFSSESALEDGVYRLKTAKTIGSTDQVTIAGSQGTASVTTVSGGKQVASVGTNKNYQSDTGVTLSAGQGVSFNYGMQSGTGGVSLTGGSGIYGNVYANGPITSDWSGFITGTAISVSSITGPGQSSFDIGQSGVGDAYAPTVTGVNAAGTVYCQSGSLNNKSCNTSRSTPTSQNFPISQSQINQWQSDGTAGGVISGNEHVGPWPNANVTLGPTEINGNLTVDSGGTLTVSGTIYVTGNVDITGGSNVNLSSSYGTNDGLIIANGTITVDSGSSVAGSGTSGSYMMLITTSSSGNAISVSGGSDAVILNAQNGTVNITGGVSAQEVEGNQINVSGGSSITYQSGLANSDFSSGPSGSYSVSSWQQTQ